MSFVRRAVYRARAFALDLTLDRRVVPFAAIAAFATSLLLRPLLASASFALLCRSHRILLLDLPTSAFCLWLNGMVERRLRRDCRAGGVVEAVASDPAPLHSAYLRASRLAGIVLKAPLCDGDRVLEKGVVLLKNTARFAAFRRCTSMPALLRHYSLVLEPSWSGYANPELLSFCIFRDHPIVVMSPCRRDHRFLERLGSNLRPIAIGASDWVDPRVFRPLDRCEKRFDAVLISRWALFKRHHLLFRALRRINDPSFRVALVAGNIPSDVDGPVIKAMISAQGLAHQIDVFEDLPPDGVNEILNQAKVNLLLSRQEGSNRSLFEGFFAGTPGLAFADHVGIPKDHFTPQTGRLIAENELADALLSFRDRWSEFDPRPWALAHIAPDVTAAKLNRVLHGIAAERGEPWTRDIVAKCNCPWVRHYPDEHGAAGFATMDDLLQSFPGPLLPADFAHRLPWPDGDVPVVLVAEKK